MIVRRLARPLLASVFIAAGIDALRHPGLRSRQAAQLLGKVPDQVPGAQSAAKDPDLGPEGRSGRHVPWLGYVDTVGVHRSTMATTRSDGSRPEEENA
jgi:hypothetical protein